MMELLNYNTDHGAPGRMAFQDGRMHFAEADDPKSEASTTCDARGLLPFPGLIDLQCNGGFGHDFTEDPSSIHDVARGLPQFGVTAFLPTIITSSRESVEAAINAFREGPSEGQPGARALGLHLEGPFLNPKRAGAHRRDLLRAPDQNDIEQLTLENGVSMVTLAPEIPGCLNLISILSERGILVSVGHSDATAAQAQEAFDRGARYATHLFNASSPFHHRDPGVPGAALVNDAVTLGVIADGVHLHPGTVKLIHRASQERPRLNLVTDAMCAMGLGPGRYTLADRPVVVNDDSARLEDGTLAGSILTLDLACRNLMAQTGCTLEAAVQSASMVPARALGIAGGRLQSGAPADVILMDTEGNVRTTFISGSCVHDDGIAKEGSK